MTMRRMLLLSVFTFLFSAWSFAGVDCNSVTPCKFTREGTLCANINCIAIKVRVDAAPAVVNFVGGPSGAAECAAQPPDRAFAGSPLLMEEGRYIIYLPLDECPTHLPFTGIWYVGRNECGSFCSPYQCGDSSLPVNCDDEEEQLPAFSIVDWPLSTPSKVRPPSVSNGR